MESNSDRQFREMTCDLPLPVGMTYFTIILSKHILQK